MHQCPLFCFIQGSRGMMGMRGFNGARGERVGLENLSLFFCENVNSLCEKTGYLSCDYTFVNSISEAI